MLLITSGAYVESELASEFGRIPPAFLPVGNRRLYTYQIRQFGGLHDQVFLTLPGDFLLDEADALWLREQGVTLFRTTPGAPLGEAVHEFLSGARVTGPLDILYGDTLITDPLREGSDWLAVGHTDEYYDWHHEAPAWGQPGGAWTGLFSFSDAALLRDKLAAAGDFIAAVGAYDRQIGGLAHWEVSRWLDFGHVHTYFDSKRIMTTQRHFNRLRVVDGVVTKSGEDAAKIMAEASWFEQAPAPIKPFLAPYICRIGGREHDACAYQLEYLHLATLNELYVFGRLPERVWRRIFGACDAYLRTASSLAPAPAPEFSAALSPALSLDYMRQTYLDKTMQRLAAYAGQAGVDLDAPWTLNGRAAPPLRAIAHEAADALLAAAPLPSFLHGDFCFSNILFDFRAGRVKTIDPRGTDALGRPSRFGDLRYDLGKLAHSVLGLYDFIVAG
ncbi:MAG: phosphotransferase, partial [Ramlibacter sp.]